MSTSTVQNRTLSVKGLTLFYREAGNPANPTILLLHGYPSSSFMFRDLMRELADDFHLIAPDYPGFGHSETPAIDDFAYTFDHLSDVIEAFVQTLNLPRFALYVQDYGAPVGLRIAARHPEWITALLVQNGNAYEEGFTPAWAGFRALWADRNADTEAGVKAFFAPETTRFFYAQGTREPNALSPDTWSLDQFFLDKPANRAAQLELFYDYRSNPPQYPVWHTYFRQHQPPTLLVWGKNDPFFGPDGATAFQRDLPNAELHLLDTGHFALEEDGVEIAGHIRSFLAVSK
jgi:pimeloyl-ACP methyl ester carboxylesterase